MRKKIVSGILLTLLLVGMLTWTFNIQPAKADETFDVIYIKADGSIDPATAPIQRVGDVYTLTGNIACPIYVEKDGIIVDGGCYKLIGSGQIVGISLLGLNDVTIKNFIIQGFENGIYIEGGGGHTITANYLRNNAFGISLYSSDLSRITNNVIAENGMGICVEASSENNIALNLIMNNDEQIGYEPYIYDNYWFIMRDEGCTLGNFWSNYWGHDTSEPADGVGETNLPHEGVDYNPLLDPSIPMQFGELPFGPDWWLVGSSILVWRGGWSPVEIQVTDALGHVISADENQVGLNAFYAEENIDGHKMVMILIVVPVPLDNFEGVYTFQMTAGADLTYWMEWFVSTRGQVLFSQSVNEVPLTAGQTKYERLRLTMNPDGSVGVFPISVPTSTVPEVPVGAVLAAVSMTIAFGAYLAVPKLRSKRLNKRALL